MAILFLLVTGCGSTPHPAPVVNRVISNSYKPADSIDNKKESVYIVKRGDTLYNIAIDHGIDIKKLALLNKITDPGAIAPGQRIYLSVPLSTSQQSEQPTLFAFPHQAELFTEEGKVSGASNLMPPSESVRGQVKTAPKGIKMPYSDQALAKVKRLMAEEGAELIAPVAVSTSAASVASRIEVAPVVVSYKPAPADTKASTSGVKWVWPTKGRVLEEFSSRSKGIKISGEYGQAIAASAAGQVVYSGNGLRGYGNLLIIKHNKTFLTAYAHNSKLMVEEGEIVTKGQKIAEMGSSDTNTVKLHFEIRINGRPADPLKFLPTGKRAKK